MVPYINYSTVEKVAREAAPLMSHRMHFTRGVGRTTLTVEVFHDYYNTVNVRFLVDGEWVGLSGADPYQHPSLRRHHCRAMNDVADVLKQAWRSSGKALPPIDGDGLVRVDYRAIVQARHSEWTEQRYPGNGGGWNSVFAADPEGLAGVGDTPDGLAPPMLDARLTD